MGGGRTHNGKKRVLSSLIFYSADLAAGWTGTLRDNGRGICIDQHTSVYHRSEMPNLYGCKGNGNRFFQRSSLLRRKRPIDASSHLNLQYDTS